MARKPITKENLLRLVRDLHTVGALGPAIELLPDSHEEVRGEAADTVGSLATYPLGQVTEADRDAARQTLLMRWAEETDQMVRSCVAYSLVALAEPDKRPLFDEWLLDRDDRVQRQGRTALARLRASEQGTRNREGTALQGRVGTYDYADLAELIHRHCCEADPYGLQPHPRQRHIRWVLEYGFRERLADADTVVARGRHFDILLEEDCSAGWLVRVTDPEGLPECRRPADHRHRLLLRPLVLDPEDLGPSSIAAHVPAADDLDSDF